MRAANLMASRNDRIGDRDNVLDATFLHLTEAFEGKEVYLIGTMNCSNLLAQRTQKLIQDVKPDLVLV